MGHEIATAYDGIEGIEVAETFRPDVILLDIGLPRLNGLEMARLIREQPWGKSILLVAVTGYGQEEDRRRSLEAGFDYHMVKPIRFCGITKKNFRNWVSHGLRHSDERMPAQPHS